MRLRGHVHRLMREIEEDRRLRMLLAVLREDGFGLVLEEGCRVLVESLDAFTVTIKIVQRLIDAARDNGCVALRATVQAV